MSALSDLHRRLLVTAAAIALSVGLTHIPLPGIELPEVRGLDRLSVGDLGVMPFLTAAVAVELAAWIVPRWRGLRAGAGRAALARASERLALALAGLQAFTLASSLRDLLGVDSVGLWTLSLMAGFAAQLALARWIDRAGLVSGLPALVVTLGAPALTRQLVEVVRPDPNLFAEPNPVPALAVAALAALTLANQRWRGPDRGATPLPLGGLLPLWLAMLVAPVGSILGWIPQDGGPSGALYLAGPVLVAALGTAIFAAIWSPRGALLAVGASEADVSAAGRRSLLFAVGVAALGWTLERRHGLPGTALVSWTALVLLAGDLVAELRARAAHPDLGPAEADPRVHLLVAAADRLEAEGVPVLVRHAGFRAFARSLGPFAPLELWVPASKSARAAEVVAELRGKVAGGAPPGEPAHHS